MEWFSWFFVALKKYYSFSGRARRKEFWCFVLVSTFSWVALEAAETLAGSLKIALAPHIKIGVASLVYGLLLVCPFFAVTARRLHDINRSGWWQLVHLVPLLGTLVLLVFASEDSYPGENRYGKNPRGRCLFIMY